MSDLISFKKKDLAEMYNADTSSEMVLYTHPTLIRTTKDKTFTLAAVDVRSGDKEPERCNAEDGVVFCKGTLIGASPTFVACYELHGVEINGDDVMLYGHEEIIRFDMNDIAGTLKITYTM